jgi:hypothetical protein
MCIILLGFDQLRLAKILTLPYEDWLKGTAGFYGYIILKFAHTPKVLMECPFYGNAIYVLDSGEKRLLKMNKQELITSGEAKRFSTLVTGMGESRKGSGLARLPSSQTIRRQHWS